MASTLDSDAAFMATAIRLAMRGRGSVEPNPMVGCVIVKDGRVIGEGFHQKCGQAHAEPNALAACGAGATGATAYATLEPCRHRNKQTPPCVPRLIGAGIARVVIGCLDPNPAVAGKGAAELRAAGVRVEIGVMEAQARQLAAPFFAGIVRGRPYMTLKWAQSADGKIAGPAGRRVQIGNAVATRLVHELRGRCDGILVGINTVLNDDPALTVRGVPALRHPTPIVLDTHGRLPLDCRLMRQSPRLLVFCGNAASSADLCAPGASARGDLAQRVPLDATGRLSLPEVLRLLWCDHRMTHVLVEPGPTLAKSFLEQGLADRVWVIHSRAKIADPTAPAAATVPFPPTAETDLAGDRLCEHLNPASDVYFSPDPSADLLLPRR